MQPVITLTFCIDLRTGGCDTTYRAIFLCYLKLKTPQNIATENKTCSREIFETFPH